MVIHVVAYNEGVELPRESDEPLPPRKRHRLARGIRERRDAIDDMAVDLAIRAGILIARTRTRTAFLFPPSRRFPLPVHSPQPPLQEPQINPFFILRHGPQPATEPRIREPRVREDGTREEVARRHHPDGARQRRVREALQHAGDALACAARDGEAGWVRRVAIFAVVVVVVVELARRRGGRRRGGERGREGVEGAQPFR